MVGISVDSLVGVEEVGEEAADEATDEGASDEAGVDEVVTEVVAEETGAGPAVAELPSARV